MSFKKPSESQFLFYFHLLKNVDNKKPQISTFVHSRKYVLSTALNLESFAHLTSSEIMSDFAYYYYYRKVTYIEWNKDIENWSKICMQGMGSTY